MDFRLPELGEGVYEAELVNWLVKPGDRIKRGQGLMEVMTDKATMEVPSPFAGTITGLRAEPGRQIKVGDVVLSYAGGDQPAEAPQPAKAQKTAKTEKGQARAAEAKQPEKAHVAAAREPVSIKAAPSVRLMARKLGVDLREVHGSGPGGRILIDDLSRRFMAEAPAERPAKAEPKPDYGTPGTRIKFQGLRRKIGERMVQSKRTIPHYTYVDECDVTDLVRLRDSLRETYAASGIKLTYLAFIVKAAALALKDVPIVNASLDEEGGEIVLHNRYDIGVAVAAPSGLIVPVVRDVDKKSLAAVARDIERLSSEARSGRAKLEDLKGSTFTVTSIGSIGGLISTPVINYPEVAILGIGKVIKRPVYDDAGSIRPADLMYLSISCDHRVVDGAVGAVFGNAVMRHLRNPATLLLPEKLI